jgi:hypothetical protein
VTGQRRPDDRDTGAWVMALLAARFVIELALLLGMAVGAVSVVAGPWGWVLAVVLVALTATVWGVFLAPRRRVVSPLPVRIGLELALFVTAAALLGAGGRVTAGALLLGAEVVVLVALRGPDRHAPEVR